MLPGPVTRLAGSTRRRRRRCRGRTRRRPARHPWPTPRRRRGARTPRGWWVRPAAVVLLRRARHGQARHLRELGRHDVHHDAARVDREASGHVEAHPVDGHPALGDRATVRDLRRGVGRRWSAWTSRARRMLSSRAARTAGSSVARAAAMHLGGDRRLGGRMPSKRSAASYRARHRVRRRRRRSDARHPAPPRRRARRAGARP